MTNSETTPVLPGFYRHWKGAVCEVICVAIDPNDFATRRVVYRDRAGDIWSRTEKEFAGPVAAAFGNIQRVRFAPLASEQS